MTNSSSIVSPVTAAKTAGGLYLAIAVFGAFAIGYVPSVIIVAGDGASTIANLLDNKALFQLGIFADLVVMLLEIALTSILYTMFRPVSPTVSMLALLARFSMIGAMAFNVLFNVMALSFATNAAAPAEVQTTITALFDAHAMGIHVWGVFFGTHLLALGYLVLKSGFFPKIFGYGMFLGGFGYLLEGTARLTFVENPAVDMAIIGLLVTVTIAELSFAFWLAIKGLDLAAYLKVTAKPATA